ncbi:MAG: serine kinase [Alphaproteobacteria bacterium]|nr:serine kinase [Alphaproteobacteria bacterium]
MPELYYNATSVSIDGIGLLIEGAPKTGKSSLALSLIDEGAKLISDDLTFLSLKNNKLYALPQKKMTGQLFIRELGFLKIDRVQEEPIEVKALIGLSLKEDDFLNGEKKKNLFGVEVKVFNFLSSDYALTKKIKAVIKLIQKEWELKE